MKNNGYALYRKGAKSKRFREFYKNAKIISKDIKNIEYSISKEREWVKKLYQQKITQESYKDYVYKLFNIRQYKNMDELRRDMIDYGYSKEQIAKIESEYKHRDLLIGSGQYQEYRIRNYQSRYLRALKIANVNPYIIENIKALSTGAFSKLVGLRDARTDNTSKYKLPQLGGFNYYTMGVFANDKTKEIEDAIKDAFSEAGIKFDEDIIANPIHFEPKATTYTLRSTLSRLFPNKVAYLNSATTEKDYKERAFLLIEDAINSGKKIYKEHNGIATLSFIGKAIPTSKNYSFVYEFQKFHNNK